MRKALTSIGSAVAAGVIALAASPAGAANHRPAGHHARKHHAAVKVVPTAPKAPAGTTMLATLTGATTVYTGPGTGITHSEGPTWEGAPEVLPVIAEHGTWLQVELPERPNGTTGWVQYSTVALSETPYKIFVSLTASPTLTLTDAGHVVFTAPVGPGATDDPTPTGNYFIAYKGEAPDASYGPWVLVTSAHSNAISDWESSGDANIGIHGPLGADAQIPGYISHGCIRMHLADQAQLAVVPAGTPVVIQA